MKPSKNFTGSTITTALLKGFAWSNAGVGLLIIIAIAWITPNIALVADQNLATKLLWILGTLVSFGLTSSLLFAAAYGLEIARDTNYRVGLNVQIAVRTLEMAQAVSTPLYTPPTQGAPSAPLFTQPQPPQPGQSQ